MKIIITKNARALVSTILKEHELQMERYMKDFIERDQIEQCLIERLNAIGKRSPSMRAFLTYVGPIDPREDDDKDVAWAKDPREGRRHVVNSVRDTAEGTVGGAQSPDAPWPEPGERVC